MEFKKVQKLSRLSKAFLQVIIIALVLLQVRDSHAQKHDYRWVTGNGSDEYDTLGGSIFIEFDDFEFSSYSLVKEGMSFDFAEYCVNYADREGDLVFYSNGIKIWNGQHKEMEGSEGFNDHEFHRLYVGFGLPFSQGGIALPYPGHDSLHVYIHMKLDYYGEGDYVQPYGLNIYNTVIRHDGEVNASVVKKGALVLLDTLEMGGLTATKHANGQDWWILMPRKTSNQYHVLLLDKNGLRHHSTQTIGQVLKATHGVHQAHFSPDGKKYIRNVALHYTEVRDAYLDIYDFDRCTGVLSDHRQFQYADDAIAGGNAISPNSRFLYVNQGERLYQYDLEADDIEASAILIGEWDGFLYKDFFPTRFYNMQLAPDGKIYMTCISGIKPMHVIHYPNKRGKACAFEQRGIFLPRSNTSSVPNHPNYRLGPIDDSLCDTLDIDNIPLAGWRHRDRYLEVEFTSVSDYEPSTWAWNFGDGTSSQDTCPIHYYMKEGTYEVCLTVSNIHGEDTYCKNITVKDSLSAVEIVEHTSDMALYPNPACDYASVYSKKDLGSVSIDIYDNQGRLVQHTKDELFSDKAMRIDVSGLPAGIYMIEVKKRGVGIKKMKLVVVK